ncbi:MAG: protein-L-isoaspartate O-methyltransferase [Candidatus Binatia bacterium]
MNDLPLLAAMRAVPRESFIAAELAEFAYEDAPLHIDAGQTISQPYIVAAMTAALEKPSSPATTFKRCSRFNSMSTSGSTRRTR